MSTYTEALARASHVLRQIGAMPDPRADDLSRADEEPAATPTPPVAPLRPSDAIIEAKAAQVDADLRKPVPPPIPAPREIAARLAPLVEPWTTASQVVCMVADAMGMEPPDVLNRRMDWVIVGGESGSHARPMNPDWARRIRDDCKAAGVAFHFKQWGEWCDYETAGASGGWEFTREKDGRRYGRLSGGPLDGREFETRYPWVEKDTPGYSPCMVRVGKKAAGRLLDGVLHDAVPTIPAAALAGGAR